MNGGIRRLLYLAVLATALLPLAIPGAPREAGDERILSYHSHITVHDDSSMTVRETIKVRSAGREIKRGIYRDFPTRYKDRLGNRYVVDFTVKEVLRDGEPEAYHIKNLSNGKRIYMGKKNVFLKPGEYTYTITYGTNRQLGFFDDHDELYWNVTGNGWAFPIDRALATIELPRGIPRNSITLEGYTGPQGSTAQDYEGTLDKYEYPSIHTTKPMGPSEGLTIAVSWPKGFVSEPTPETKARYFFRDNFGAILGTIGLLLLVGYYLIMWSMVGKDPRGETIIPLFKPPEGFSPAAMRYITRMGYDHKAFAAAIIDMAVKGFLKIREEGGVYTLERKMTDRKGLAPEEKKIAVKLLVKQSEIELKQKNHAKIGKAVKALKKSLKTSFETIYFITNRKYFVPGAILSVITLILLALFSAELDNILVVLFMTIWLSGWSVGVVFLCAAVVSSWRGVLLGKGAHIGGAIAITLFSLPFLAGEVFVIFMLAYLSSMLIIAFLAAIVFINCLFYHLLKAPTRAGRMLLDKIEGFKMYLSVAEKERLNLLNPPEKTPELFERYLPYAIALGVENAWSEQFSDILARAGESGEAYSPGWYSGASWSSSEVHSFTSSLGGAFSSAISSSSTAPGSSSGGGGGGFSGGGGGGGGGGGW